MAVRRFTLAPHVARRWAAGVAVAALVTAAGCGDSEDGSGAARVASGAGFDEPTGLAFRPGTEDELWVTNHGDDSISIIRDASGADADERVENRRDAYAEHFVARPDGIAFDPTGAYFAVASDSNNEVRGLDFKINPERNRFFKNNNFMGPALFAAETYALAGQSKAYLEDWPQPGYGHDPPDDIAQRECPIRYWSTEADSCIWPREGSHLDMLHGSPLSAGILNRDRNSYYVLDGCGTRATGNRCRGDGHVTLVDFNRDHQEGNGFHGDGTIRRYIDAPFERFPSAPSGIVEHEGQLYYSDSGAGVVRRLDPNSGRIELLVGPWHPGPASHHQQGPGPTDWAHVAHGPPDGDDPAAVDDWIESAGDAELIAAQGRRWIEPMESLGEYSYVTGTEGEALGGTESVERPSGLAAGEDYLYVADNAGGSIHSFAWDGFEPGPALETGAESLGGLALSPSGEEIYFTDVAGDSVGRIALPD